MKASSDSRKAIARSPLGPGLRHRLAASDTRRKLQGLAEFDANYYG
jgi:hypothetical protein